MRTEGKGIKGWSHPGARLERGVGGAEVVSQGQERRLDLWVGPDH